ncbi:MAG: bifunctional pyr operon transcriptional regulator/uracil phosphoribosyltransferase PyrR [Planctomycetes bacterium]|nr:bifunctional pyr operon transcriptional regulator/uracil phosphoribosyltransferase PyrR [Planctomycetota bacterium]
MTDSILHDGGAIDAQIKRLAAEIADGESDPPALIGIRTHGVPLAARLADAMEAAGRKRPQLGAIDITLYRDDLAGKALPQVLGSEIRFDIEGRRVVLVDDVLFTGRTVRAALTELADYGRPRRVELCALVDRGHRELPICADYTGFKVETDLKQRIRVRLKEGGDAEDAVVLVKP